MKQLSRFFIDNSKLTVVLSIGLMIFGVMGLKDMNSESYPTVDFAQAIVTTRYDGASASDVETKITKPIEDEVRTVSGLKDVRSISQSGLSTIFIRADIDNIDVKEVMSDLQKAVDRVTDLPRDLNDPPAFREIKSEEFPVAQIAIIGSNKNRFRDLVADLLKEDIEDNKGVKGVTFTGFTKRQFNIELNTRAMAGHHIGIDEVMGKIQARNVNIPGGSLKERKSQSLLRIEGKIKNTEDLENILIRSNLSGQEVYLKDVAKVTDGKNEIKVKAIYNGKPATLLTVSKKAGSDTIKLVNDIQIKIDRFKEIYKDKLGFTIFNNEAVKVKNKLDVLESNALSGLILVVVFLFIFLPGRIGLIASLSLPLAVMGTMGLMPAFGMNLNAVTILALVIALGMLVDNSVVISENFTRLRSEGQSNKDAAVESVRQLWLPITATAFTTIAAFLPMLVTKGIMGQFIKFIPIIVSISLLLSLGESFFLLPMRLAHWSGKLKTSAAKSGKDWFSRFEKGFEKFMDFCVRRRYFISVIFSGLLFGAFYMMIKANTFNLFPAEQTEIYVARFQLENGTRIEQTNRVAAKLSRKIKADYGEHIKHIVARVGASKIDLTDPKAEDGNNVGILFVYVDEYAKNNIAHTEFLNNLRKIKPKYAGNLTYEAQVNGPPVGEAIEATFRSNNLTSLNTMINKIKEDLVKEPGILNLKVNDVVGDDEVYVNINYALVDRLGLNVNSIGNTIRTAVSGRNISTVTLDNKNIDLRLSFKEVSRQNIKDLERIKVMDKRGNLVPLKNFATFTTKKGTPQIKRFDFKRSKTLTGNIDEAVVTSMVANKKLKELYDEYSKEITGVSLVFGGAQESTNESMQSLAKAGLLAAIGIFAILVFLFKSYLRPLIIMMTIPLGLLGFSIAFYTPVLSGFPDRSRQISFLALIGIIGLAGIIVNSGIVLISFIDQMREEGKLNLHDILVKASGMRLRAVLVTSLTTISGLLPTAYGVGGSDAMLVPMTLAMAWGLTSGTILTLIFIPCAYAILEDFNSLMSRIYRAITNSDEQDEQEHLKEPTTQTMINN